MMPQMPPRDNRASFAYTARETANLPRAFP